jgi:hypothetical protein
VRTKSKRRDGIHSQAFPQKIRSAQRGRRRQRDQIGRDLEAVRLDLEAVLGAPCADALDQEAARAADVEKGSIAVDRRHDGSAATLPARSIAGLSRLLPRRPPGEVGRDDDRGYGVVPALLVDVASLECLVDRGQCAPASFDRVADVRRHVRCT